MQPKKRFYIKILNVAALFSNVDVTKKYEILMSKALI